MIRSHRESAKMIDHAVFSDNPELERRINRGTRQGNAVLWVLRIFIWVVIAGGAVFWSDLLMGTFLPDPGWLVVVPLSLLIFFLFVAAWRFLRKLDSL
jgi:hypothetical protein